MEEKKVLKRFINRLNIYVKYKKKLYLYKSIYFDMVLNITELSLINYFKESNDIYINILNELDKIKRELELLPENITLYNYKYYKIKKIKSLIYKCFNIISPKKIDRILELYDKNWINNFKDNDYLQLLLYIDFVNATNILEYNITDKTELLEYLNNKRVYIEKNKKAITLFDNKYGCSIYLNINNKYIIIQGFFKDDIFNLAVNNIYIKNIIKSHNELINKELINIPNEFKINYLNVIHLRDKVTNTSRQITDEVRRKYNDFKTLHKKPLTLLLNEFLLGSKYRKIDILTLLLISDKEDQNLAFILFDTFKIKDKQNIYNDIYNSLHHSIRKKLDISKKESEDEIEISETDISYEKRISLLEVSNDIKSKALDKLKLIKNNFQGDSKSQYWLDGLLKIPFNIYSENDIISFKKKYLLNKIEDKEKWNDYLIKRQVYLKEVRETLDKAVYGHKTAKLELERIFAQWINGENTGAILGLHGPPGTGKTSLIKNGLSKCLKDSNGKPRPFAFLAIGGSVNGSTLVGHNYTYVGSTWGRIVDILISSKCMNPIIFIDELDKVSNTDYGQEIISILTHLTDSTQNDEFEDKFFAGIKLDLSKALIIFSFNNKSLIDPILRDRITIIDTHPININEKIIIIKNYILDEICKTVGLDRNDIIFDNTIIKYLIETYTSEPGVRKIKEKIFEIIRDINLKLIYNEITLPFTITIDYCNTLFKKYPKIKVKKIYEMPLIGVVNGLYATSSGIGGITLIQAVKYPSTKILDLHLTGALGDIMKESIHCSLKIAYRLLSNDIQEYINSNPFGIHLHCPEGSVKKDGPSAGVAITLAIYSLLINTPVDNTIGLTGEIDLLGNITAIGGLEAKINGAKNAGIKTILYPYDNIEDIEIIENDESVLNNLNLIPVKHIDQVFNFCFSKD